MQELSYLNIQNLSSISPQGSPILIEQWEFQVIGIENKTIGPACRGTQESFIFTWRPPPPLPQGLTLYPTVEPPLTATSQQRTVFSASKVAIEERFNHRRPKP